MAIARQILVWNPNETPEMRDNIYKFVHNKRQFHIQHALRGQQEEWPVGNELLSKDFMVIFELDSDKIRDWIRDNKSKVWADPSRMRIEDVELMVLTDKKREDFKSMPSFKASRQFHVCQDAVDGVIPFFSARRGLDSSHVLLDIAPIIFPMTMYVDDNVDVVERRVAMDWRKAKPFPSISFSIMVSEDGFSLPAYDDEHGHFHDKRFIPHSFDGGFALSMGVSTNDCSPTNGEWLSGDGIVNISNAWPVDAALSALEVKIIDLSTCRESQSYRSK